MSERDFEAFWELLLANIILPVNNSLIDYPVKRYDRAFELASDVINENFTARIPEEKAILSSCTKLITQKSD